MNLFIILTSCIIILTNLVTLLEGGFGVGFGSGGFRPTNSFAPRPVGPVHNPLSTYNAPRISHSNPTFSNVVRTQPTFTTIGRPNLERPRFTPARTRPPHFYPSSGSSITRSRSPSPKSYHHTPLHNSQHTPLPDSQRTPLPGNQRTPIPGSQRTPLPGSQRTPLPGSKRTPLNSQNTPQLGSQHISQPGSQLTSLTGSRRTPLPSSQHSPQPSSHHTTLSSASLHKKPSVETSSTSLNPTNARTFSPQRLPSAPLPKEFTINPSQKPRSRSPPGHDSEMIAVKKLFSGDQSITPPRSRSTSPVLPSAPLPKAFLNELESVGKTTNIAKEKGTKLSHGLGSTEFYLKDKIQPETKPVSLSGSQNAPAITSKDKPQVQSVSKPYSKPKSPAVDKQISGASGSKSGSSVPTTSEGKDENSPLSVKPLAAARLDPGSKSGTSVPTTSLGKDENSPLSVKPLAAAGIGSALSSTNFLMAEKNAIHTASINPGHLSPPVSRVLDQPHFPVIPKTIDHTSVYLPVSPPQRFKWNPSEAIIGFVKMIG